MSTLYGDGFLRRWFWRAAEQLWTEAMYRFGQQQLLARGFVLTSYAEQQLARDDERAILTALVFVLEILDRADIPMSDGSEFAIGRRAKQHLDLVALARLHRSKMDYVRELPRTVLSIEEQEAKCLLPSKG
jgi:hypothetical protein